MARFKYLGEQRRPTVFVQGPCMQINIPLKDGTWMEIDAPPGGFVIGNDIGVDINDSRSIRVMQADPRFQQIS